MLPGGNASCIKFIEKINEWTIVSCQPNAMCIWSRPSMQHPTASSACLSTQTLWTSTMASCQTPTRRILTLGTCRRLVWREVPSTLTMETCSHLTWLPKVSSGLLKNGTQGSQTSVFVFFIVCLLSYSCTLAPIISEGDFYKSYMQPHIKIKSGHF